MDNLTQSLTGYLEAGGEPLWLLLAVFGLAVLVAALAAFLLGRVFARSTQPMQSELHRLSQELHRVHDTQAELRGGISVLAEHTGQSQQSLRETFEARMAALNSGVGERLQTSAEKTAKSLGDLQARLAVIDKAQANITRLSGDVLSLQDILANKQTRGHFGEIQLNNILEAALPADSYELQATLSNSRRADALIKLPLPPGPIVIDSKFPLEAYETLVREREDRNDPRAIKEAGRAFRDAVRLHIKAISERYIIEGETADGALMFLPSEAVYAELHSNFSEITREGFERHVWIVSPTTCMAVLTTLRAVLKDARMRRHAADIRKALGLLGNDMRLVSERVEALQKHFLAAEKSLGEISTAARRGMRRADSLTHMEFDGLEEDNKSTDEAKAEA